MCVTAPKLGDSRLETGIAHTGVLVALNISKRNSRRKRSVIGNWRNSERSRFLFQSERSEFRPCGLIISMKDASDPQDFGDLREHRSVLDIYDLVRRYLGDVEREPKYISVWFQEVDEARGNEEIYKSVEFEFLNPICIQLSPFIAEDGDFQPVKGLEP